MQTTHFVNCCTCGHIVEVVCPDPNRDVARVYVEQAIGFGNPGDHRNYQACPYCRQGMWIIWYFRP